MVKAEMRIPLIGVIGARECDDTALKNAYDAGRLIALNGYGMVCGGMGGVMEAAAKGCQEEGGLTVGILPRDTDQYANDYLSVAIPTGMGIMRNLLIVRTARGLIAVNGKYGTLSEIAYALQLEKPIVGIGTWDVSDELAQFRNAASAIEHLMGLL